MTKEYYYFVGSLSAIDFGDEVPVELEDFKKNSQRLLDIEDAELIENILSSEETDCEKNVNPVLKKYSMFNNCLRNKLAIERAIRFGKDAADYDNGIFCDDLDTEAAAVSAIKELEHNPLKAEELLDKARWHFLNEITKDSFFDFDIIVAYTIKLKILSKYRDIKTSKGREKLEEIRNKEYYAEAM